MQNLFVTIHYSLYLKNEFFKNKGFLLFSGGIERDLCIRWVNNPLTTNVFQVQSFGFYMRRLQAVGWNATLDWNMLNRFVPMLTFHPFHAIGLIQYSLKISENPRYEMWHTWVDILMFCISCCRTLESIDTEGTKRPSQKV